MRNIIITGGELFNKGAQAMVFITVDELKKRFPEHEIYVLSEMDRRRSESEKSQYNFKFIGWYPLKYAKSQTNPIIKITCLLHNGKEYREAKEIYSNTDLMIDISGYALGSNWGINHLTTFADNLEFAKAYDIPIYLMPQSFGPFDFQDSKKLAVDRRLFKLLPYAKMICAREKESLEAIVDHYRLTNVCLKNDLVLCNKGVDYSNIYVQPPVTNIIDIIDNSIGIIPNSKLLEVASEEVYSIYYAIINSLLSIGKQIYLISHSTLDVDFCKTIKERFSNEKQVVFLDREINCFEFDELVKHFQFIISSRFHSIVYAYKNGVPCISIGWAAKYRELLAQFNQEQYLFNIQDNICTDEIINSISFLEKHSEEECVKIKKHLSEIQKDNVFDIIS